RASRTLWLVSVPCLRSLTSGDPITWSLQRCRSCTKWRRLVMMTTLRCAVSLIDTPGQKSVWTRSSRHGRSQRLQSDCRRTMEKSRARHNLRRTPHHCEHFLFLGRPKAWQVSGRSRDHCPPRHTNPYRQTKELETQEARETASAGDDHHPPERVS